ncbi:hypothetical protein P9112_008683 [Eukaryota sp. TZLM1-RC]
MNTTPEQVDSFFLAQDEYLQYCNTIGTGLSSSCSCSSCSDNDNDSFSTSNDFDDFEIFNEALQPSTLGKFAGFIGKFFIYALLLSTVLVPILSFFLDGSASEQSHYSILGVSSSASEQEIRKAYKKLSRTEHPDKCISKSRSKCEERWASINNAYKLLKDPQQRLRYDRVRMG